MGYRGVNETQLSARSSGLVVLVCRGVYRLPSVGEHVRHVTDLEESETTFARTYERDRRASGRRR